MAENEKVAPMMTSAHTSGRPIRFVVVGAGGTGGRLIPGMMQVLRRNDEVAIVDGDHVEDRNLLRQNFRQRDIGENKAEVMASRYRRDHIHVDAYNAMIDDALIQQIMRPLHSTEVVGTIILGCVDNWRARRVMEKAMQSGSNKLWIDAGNERRGGQVLLTAKSWPFQVNDLAGGRNHTTVLGWTVPGLKTAMPQLLDATPWHCARCDVDNAGELELCGKCNQPEASCADRLDIQTVAVNQLAATSILNILSQILYKVPFNSAGAFFSTQNTMSPIPLDKVDASRYIVTPVTSYAGTSA